MAKQKKKEFTKLESSNCDKTNKILWQLKNSNFCSSNSVTSDSSRSDGSNSDLF